MTGPDAAGAAEPGGDQTPPPLTVAASVVAVQGVVLVLLAALELAAVSPGRRPLGVSTAIFFGAYGALLLAAGWALWRRTPWARGPVLLTQLICLGLAWNLRDVVALAILIAFSAVVTLVGLVHPDSVAALSGTTRDDLDGPGNIGK